MAWRIDEAVVRGEIDNRTRGKVTGRIWFVGRDEPVVLDLDGDCHRDLAGRRLEFTNREPKAGDLERFAAVQRGSTGDITASRKVRVPDIPMDQIGEYYEAKKPFPWHWGNALYLEWYSDRNGRVLIESAAYDLRIVGEAQWDMTAAEEENQRNANAAAMDGFVHQLSNLVDQQSKPSSARTGGAEGASSESDATSDAEDAADFAGSNAEDDEDDDTTEDGAADAASSDDADEEEEWDETPMTEAEAEQFEADREKLADRIRLRLEREGENADYERILEEEIDRLRRERGEPEPTPEQRARNAQWMAEMEEVANELDAAELEAGQVGATDDAEGAKEDEDDDEGFGPKHPLSEQAYRLAVRVLKDTDEFGWQDESGGEEHPVAELLRGIMVAGAKLAGALDGEEWPPDLEFSAQIIVRLKKARVGIDDALLAAEACLEENLTDAAWLRVVRAEMIEMGESIDALIAELRSRFERGCE